jgi:acetyl esterase/lipase
MLQVNTANYSLWGGSAGARMAANLGSYGTSSFGQPALPRPVTVVMQYTGYTNYTENDPATFAVVGDDDWIANWKTMESRTNSLKRSGIVTEFHHYPDLGHGFGQGIGTTAEGWLDLAAAFWMYQIKN